MADPDEADEIDEAAALLPRVPPRLRRQLIETIRAAAEGGEQ